MKWYKHGWSWTDTDWWGVFLSVYNDPLIMIFVGVAVFDFLWDLFVG